MANFNIISVFKQLLYIFFAIILSLTAPIAGLTIILPIHTYRFILSKCITLFRPSFGKMLTTRSSFFATDTIYTSPKANLCVLLTLEGDLTKEEFKETLQQKVLEAKTKEGHLIFPELTKYIHHWGWFYFWRPEKNFNIDAHIIIPSKPLSPVPEGEPTWNHERTLEYNTSLLNKPWVNGQSPWEFHLIRNYEPFPNTRTEKRLTGLLLLSHHSLSDGYSIFNLLTIATKTKFDWAKPAKLMQKKKNECHSWLRILINKCLFPFRIPYDGAKSLVEGYDVNGWHEQNLTGTLHAGYCPLFPIDKLKEIKNHYGVSLTAVILALFTGAVRNGMIATGNKVPKCVHSVCPLPLPGHPQKLRNYMTGCLLELPVGTDDAVKRLMKIHYNLKELKHSTIPWIVGLGFPIIGGLFSWMLKLLLQQKFPTCVVTNFPGPDKKIDVYGRTMNEINFGGGFNLGKLCVGMSSLSYNGSISILIGLDKGICVKGLCDEGQVGSTLANFVLEEVELLRKLAV